MAYAFGLEAPIYVAGHRGLVGSAVWRRLESEGFGNLIGWRSGQVDLRPPAGWSGPAAVHLVAE